MDIKYVEERHELNVAAGAFEFCGPECFVCGLLRAVKRAREAAEHFRYCDLAGGELEHRCERCKEASLKIKDDGDDGGDDMQVRHPDAPEDGDGC